LQGIDTMPDSTPVDIIIHDTYIIVNPRHIACVAFILTLGLVAVGIAFVRFMRKHPPE
jgi:hypothetical protein